MRNFSNGSLSRAFSYAIIPIFLAILNLKNFFANFRMIFIAAYVRITMPTMMSIDPELLITFIFPIPNSSNVSENGGVYFITTFSNIFSP